MGAGRLRPTSHASLLVTLADGTRWLADVGFAVANHFASTHPRSPFTGRLLAQTTGEHERRELIDTELKIFRTGEPVATRHLDLAELPEVLHDRFGLGLTDTEAADLARTVAAPSAS